MKSAKVNIAVLACLMLSSGAVFAKGSGGGHGGGHGSGGHASGGHSSGGGHAGGHASGGTNRGSSPGHGASRGKGPTGGSTATPSTQPATHQSGAVHRRDDGFVVGTAVRRTTPPSVAFPRSNPSFRVLRYPVIGLGFGGLGFLYDPFSAGYGFGFASLGYGGYGFGPAPAYGYAADPFDRTYATGSIRLQVEPETGEVFVDGYYAGIVDEFDGHFQHLDLTPGPHHIEIVAPDYEPLSLDVTIQPHKKIEYRGTLRRPFE